MSDFLSNLMARSHADVPAIQPRLPSRFESGATEPLAESQSFSEPSMETQAAASENPVAPAPSQNSSVPPEHGPANLQSPLNHLRSGEISETKIAEAPIVESSQPQKNSASNVIQPIVAQPSPPKSARQFPSPQTRPVPSAPLANRFSETNHTARRRTSPQPLDPIAPKSAPAIHVTIGRVEVRAIHPPVPAPKQNKPAAPKLSLDDYLQRREGGAR